MGEMTILEKLHAIEDAKCIYNIHYSNAGVGFCFYDSEKIQFRGRFIDGTSAFIRDDRWREGLTTDKYYPTFEEAVEAEYQRLPIYADPKDLETK